MKIQPIALATSFTFSRPVCIVQPVLFSSPLPSLLFYFSLTLWLLCLLVQQHKNVSTYITWTSYDLLFQFTSNHNICSWKMYFYCGITINVAIVVSSHTPSLSVSKACSPIYLTSAHHISSTLPATTLIPPLGQIQHNQCFIWPWLNPLFLCHVKKVEWLFSVELTLSTFPVRAETFPKPECIVLQKEHYL